MASFTYPFDGTSASDLGADIVLLDPHNVAPSLSGGAGHIVTGGSSDHWVTCLYETPTTFAGMRVDLEFAIDAVAGEGAHYVDLWTRLQNQFLWDGYNISLTRNGTQWLILFWRVDEGSWTWLGENLSGGVTVTAGVRYRAAAAAIDGPDGVHLYGKVWAASDPEPAWQGSQVDTTNLYSSGYGGFAIEYYAAAPTITTDVDMLTVQDWPDLALCTTVETFSVDVGGSDAYTDTFSRSVTNGLGTAPSGDAYTLAWESFASASNTRYGVTGSAARLVHLRGDGNWSLYALLPSADTVDDFAVDFTPFVEANAAGGAHYVEVRIPVRATDAQTGYFLQISHSGPGSTFFLRWLRSGSFVGTAIDTGVVFAYGTPSRVHVRGEVLGAVMTLSATLWQGTSEPSGWQITRTTGTILTGTLFGIGQYGYSAAFNGPDHGYIFDNLAYTGPMSGGWGPLWDVATYTSDPEHASVAGGVARYTGAPGDEHDQFIIGRYATLPPEQARVSIDVMWETLPDVDDYAGYFMLVRWQAVNENDSYIVYVTPTGPESGYPQKLVIFRGAFIAAIAVVDIPAVIAGQWYTLHVLPVGISPTSILAAWTTQAGALLAWALATDASATRQHYGAIGIGADFQGSAAATNARFDNLRVCGVAVSSGHHWWSQII